MNPIARRARTAGLFALAMLAAGWSLAAPEIPASWRPSAVFVQAGAGQQVNSGAVGVSWDWDWHHDASVGRITGSTELLAGEWRAHDPGHSFTQVGVTPVLRLYPNAWGSGWFVEGAIGANAITQHYENRGKHFSTVFNFGDHLGVGRRFGTSMQHEVTLRVEHFSNGGISHPNPGENFVQVRYTRRF